MKIAVLTTRLFDQPSSGGELCSDRLLQALQSQGHQLCVVGRGAVPARESPQLSFTSLGPGLGAFSELPWWRQPAAPVQALLSGQAMTTGRMADAPSRRAAAMHLQALGCVDALVVDQLHAQAWLARGNHGLPAPIVMMHNLEAENCDERAAALRGRDMRQAVLRRLLQREARLLRPIEVHVLQTAAVVACLSDEDARRMLTLRECCDGRAAIRVLPGYPARPLATSLARAPVPRSSARPIRRIGMLGTWTWEPNRAGLQWMIEDVLPRLGPGCELVLAGRGLEAIALPPGVVVLGAVDCVAEFYAAVDLVAIASVRGSGVHEKAIEAIGLGQVVVATPHALRGLQADLPPQVHAAADAAAFATLCGTVSLPPLVQRVEAARAWAHRRQQQFQAALTACLDIATRPRARRDQ